MCESEPPGVQGMEPPEAQRFQTFEYSLMGSFETFFVTLSDYKLIEN